MTRAEKLLPCPFCGGQATIGVSDDEGNQRNEEYESNPWSGLSFTIQHTYEENNDCPIAAYDENGGVLGVHLYDTRDDAINSWNHRLT